MNETEKKELHITKYRYYAAELLAFVLLLIIAVSIWAGLLSYKDTGSGGGFANFYAAPGNSIDVMIFGNSLSACTVNNTLLWKDTGIASFTLSAGGQTVDNTYYYIREALKTQKPRLIVLETYCAVMESPDADSGASAGDLGGLYRNDLPMRWSPLYMEMVLHQAEESGSDPEQILNLLLRIPITHSRYSELSQSDFENELPFNCGYQGSTGVSPSEAPAVTENRTSLSARSEKSLRKIIALCKEKNIALLLFSAPYPGSEEQLSRENTVSDIAKQNDVPFLNFNLFWQETGIDFSKDIRDGIHLNNSGAEKITKYLEEYILQHYSLEDHRGDSKYFRWDQDVRFLADKEWKHDLDNAGDLNQYLELAGSKSDFDYMISLDGDYKAMGNVYNKSLEKMGIDGDSYEKGGTFVYSGGKFVYWSSGKDTFEYQGKMGNTNVSAARIATETEDDWDAQNTKDRLIIGETNYAHAVNGVNMVIYDPQLDLVVDSISVNIYNGLQPEHYEDDTDVHE